MINLLTLCFCFILITYIYPQVELQKLSTPYYGKVNSLTQTPDSTIFVTSSGFPSGTYKSKDWGKEWEQSLIYGSCINSDSKGNLMAGTEGSVFLPTVYLSTNSGKTWITKGFTPYSSVVKIEVDANDNFYAACNSGAIYKTSDLGTTWLKIHDELNSDLLKTFSLSKTKKMAFGTLNGDVFCSTNEGVNWLKGKSSFSNFIYYLNFGPDDLLFAIVNYNSLHFSGNYGDSWTDINTPDLKPTIITYLNGETFLGTQNGLYSCSENTYSWGDLGFKKHWIFNIQSDITGKLLIGTSEGLYRNTENESWKTIGVFSVSIKAFGINPSGNAFAGDYEGRIFISDTTKTDWRIITGINSYINDLFVDSSNYILASASNGLYRIDYKNKISQQVYSGYFSSSIISDKAGNLYAAQNQPAQIISSSDTGKTWRLFYTFSSDFIYSLDIDSSGSIVAGTDLGLYRIKKNSGSPDTLGFYGRQVRNVLVDSENSIYTYIYNYGSYVLYSDSTNWSYLNYTGSTIATFAKDRQSDIYIGTSTDGKIYKLDKNSQSFSLFGFANNSAPVNDIYFDSNNNLYAAMMGLYFASDIVLPVELIIFEYAVNNSLVTLIWETSSEKNNRGFEIQRSTYNKKFDKIGFVEGKGTTTERQTYTFLDNVNGNYFYRLKQIDFDGTFEYSKVLEVSAVPLKFSLSQNYPNPFNPTTIIKCEIPEDGLIILKIYDILGREVQTLVNEFKNSGKYSISFTADNLPSGVYFYKIQAGDYSYSETKKLLLLK